MITIKNDSLEISISEDGAEMHHIKDTSGNEFLWQASPDIWGRHAPHLFPIVGRLNHDKLIHNGKDYPMSQHGFARDSRFSVEKQSGNSCTFLLADNEKTFSQYPFHFELRIHYALNKNKLSIEYDITNTGNEVLPCSIGAHPAFNWPLPGNQRQDLHKLEFSNEENTTMHRLDNGLLKQESFIAPFSNRDLLLEDSLFVEDAMIFSTHTSRHVVLKSDGQHSVSVYFDDFPHLGVWTKPGAGFVCIEPWQGHSDPVGFDGEFSEKPGLVHINPGKSRQWEMIIEIN